MQQLYICYRHWKSNPFRSIMKHKRLLSALLLSVFLLAGCTDKGIHVEITETEPAETEETRYVADTSKNTVVLSDAAITASSASGISVFVCKGHFICKVKHFFNCFRFQLSSSGKRTFFGEIVGIALLM